VPKYCTPSIQNSEPDSDTQTCFFYLCDLDLDPMTFVYELDRDILKIYLHTKMN